MGMCIMKISTISNKQNFEGKLIVKNAISPQQKYLFNLHKDALEKQIKDMPFDLFVEQSKSRKTVVQNEQRLFKGIEVKKH